MRRPLFLLTVMMLGAAAAASTSHAQTWMDAHARHIVLAGSGTDFSHTLTLQAPALTGSSTLTLPSANSAGVLTNNGTGTLSWVNLGSPLTNPMTSPGDMIYGGLLGTPTRLAATATANQILLSGASGAPSWSTATYPATGGAAGNYLRSDGTNFISSAIQAADVPTLNQNTTGTAANVTGIVALANGGTNANLTASNGGIFYSTGTAGAILAGTATANRLLLSGASGAPSWSTATYPTTAGSAGNYLRSNGTNFVSAAIQVGDVPTLNQSTTGTAANVTGIVALANGGTNANLTASNGGIFYSTGTAGAILSGTATANQLLLSGSNAAPIWSSATYPATTTANQILYSSAANSVTGLTTANNGVLVTNGSGVPSISSTLPSAVQASITSTGTITSGTWNGSAIPVANGGTGQGSSLTQGGVIYASTTSAMASTAAGTAGQVLVSNGSGAPTWASGISVSSGHLLVPTSNAPSFVSGSSSGYSGTPSVTGSDIAGEITVTESGVAGFTVVFNFANSFSSAPFIIASPANSSWNASSAQFFIAATSTGFTLTTNKGGNGDVFKFDYVVIGH